MLSVTPAAMRQADTMTTEPPASIAAPLTVEQLFRRHHGTVMRVVRRMLGPRASQADIEDVTQQTFVAAQRSIERYRGDSAPTTWLCGIAAHVVLMHLRSWRRRTRALESFFEHWTATAPSSIDLEERYGHRQDLERVWRCLEKIKPDKRIVFVLFEVEGMSGAEIAQALEIPAATVFTRLHHARRELVALMRKERG
jgi:RNA polymerase sigma-70 factor (ECF subfamily)